MKDGICYIMGAGTYQGEYFCPKSGDFVIAADAGLKYLQDAGINADLVVGDFDSMGAVPEHPNVIRHPTVKDDTDLLLAVKQGLDLGYRRFVMFGALGKRIDHSIANLQINNYLSRRGARGYLIGGGMACTAITDGKINFTAAAEGTISVFSQCDRSTGVNLRGLKYTLDNAVLSNSMPIGVSNEFTGQRAEVSVENGTLLIIWNGGLDILEKL